MARATADEAALHDLSWGIERETQRLQANGALSRRPQPPALAPPAFTRDFAETQLEIVTPPRPSSDLALLSLATQTDVARRAVAPELLWPFSMPPALPDESAIEIARFGTDAQGRRARLYRDGLGLRYGKARQMICGVHVNVSFRSALETQLLDSAAPTPEERRGARTADALYLRLARNLYQDLPLLVLLTGASPVRGGCGRTEALAVSHRNGSNGYAGAEYQPYLDLGSLDGYLAGIRRGLRTESTAFAQLGLARDGRVHQLNARVFQTEKEFYAPIRLRQALLPGETTLGALERRGIGYLELRFLDVDPASPAGVTRETLRVLHLFVLDGLHRPAVRRGGATLAADLGSAVAAALRDPRALTPSDPLLVAAGRRLEALRPWAERLDGGPDGPYHACLAAFRGRIERPESHPAFTLARALEESGGDWTSFGIRRAQVQGGRRHATRKEATSELDDARF